MPRLLFLLGACGQRGSVVHMPPAPVCAAFAPTAVQYPVQMNSGNSTNQAVVPARVNPPTIYEPPAALTGGVAQVTAAVSGGIASVYLLAEDSSTGKHYTQQGAAGASQASGTVVTFSVYAQAAARSAPRLNLFNGSANIGCDFNLTAGTAGTTDTGITAATITNAGAGWFFFYHWAHGRGRDSASLHSPRKSSWNTELHRHAGRRNLSLGRGDFIWRRIANFPSGFLDRVWRFARDEWRGGPS
jgi:hypothetical protein